MISTNSKKETKKPTVVVQRKENPTTGVAGNVTATFWTMPALPIGRYYWKVIAKNDAGQASSDVWAFDMTSTEFATLTAPVPLTPANGAIVAQNFATLRWSASSGATPITYDVYFDQNPFPVTLVGADLVGVEHPGTGLTDGPYYWRVVGKNAFETAESSTASFTVSIPSSPATVYLEKINARSCGGGNDRGNRHGFLYERRPARGLPRKTTRRRRLSYQNRFPPDFGGRDLYEADFDANSRAREYRVLTEREDRRYRV